MIAFQATQANFENFPLYGIYNNNIIVQYLSDYLYYLHQSVVGEGSQQSIQKAETSIAPLANSVLSEGKVTDILHVIS